MKDMRQRYKRILFVASLILLVNNILTMLIEDDLLANSLTWGNTVTIAFNVIFTVSVILNLLIIYSVIRIDNGSILLLTLYWCLSLFFDFMYVFFRFTYRLFQPLMRLLFGGWHKLSISGEQGRFVEKLDKILDFVVLDDISNKWGVSIGMAQGSIVLIFVEVIIIFVCLVYSICFIIRRIKKRIK